MDNAALLRSELLQRLNQIIDPCSAATAVPAGLVDMGLIRELQVEPLENGGTRVDVKLCVTHAFCMMSAVFVNEVEKRLRATANVTQFEVTLDAGTIWTEDFMTPEYRSRLAEQRARKGLRS
jgi:metal-sulfur cluster biosynthetic enzyme